MITDITSYIERIQDLNVRLAGSQNGKEARPIITDIFSTMLEMLDTCDHSSQTENIYVKQINTLNDSIQTISEKDEKAREYLEEIESLRDSINLFISKFPPSTDQSIIRMAISDEEDNILVDENGDKLELEFSAILFDEEG